MSNLKRLFVVIAVIAVTIAIAGSFEGSNVLDRAIILGIGIDLEENGGVVMTCEVVSPGNGTEQVGTFSKTVTVSGGTVNVALQAVSELTGKETSLGQCVVLVLGNEYYENVDFSDLTEYFINHHSLKESVVMCCCEGTAKDLFDKGNALAQSVSIALSSALLDHAEKIGVPANNLLKFTRSQNELSRTGYLNKVNFVPSDNTDAQLPDKTLGYIGYREIAVFRANRYVCTLDRQEVKGFSLLSPDTVGETFVTYLDDVTRTLQVTNKEVKQKPDGKGGLEITVGLTVRYGRTDSEQVSGAFTAKNDKEIDPKLLKDVEEQAQSVAEKFLALQIERNFDLLDFHDIYRQKEGTTTALVNKPMEDFPVKITVTVKES